MPRSIALLSLVLTCILASATVSPGGRLDGAHPNTWSSQQTAAKLLEMGIVSPAAAKRIEKYNLNIFALWEVVEASDLDVMRDIGLPTEGVEKYRFKADLAILRQQGENNNAPSGDRVATTISNYAKMDFFEVREADKARFDAFLTGCGSSPQVTILMYYFHDWDFLEHFIDADTNMVLFWVQWLLVPNFLASRMMWHFSDTNFIVACVFASAQLIQIVLFIKQVLAPPDDGTEATPPSRLVDGLRRAYQGAAVGVILWRVLISYFLFGWVEDAMFYSAFFLLAGFQLIMMLAFGVGFYQALQTKSSEGDAAMRRIE